MRTTIVIRAALSALLAIVLVAAPPAGVAADEATWTRFLDAGTAAYHRRDPVEATRQFEFALKEAEGFGESDPRLATSLAWLAELYRVQRRFEESERLIRRTIALDEQYRGPEATDTASSLESLALLFHTQNRQREMEPVLTRVITIYEKALGPQHPRVASALNNLAALYRSIGRLNEAEPLVSRALAIREKALGFDHPDTVQSRNYLALLHRDLARGRVAPRPRSVEPVRPQEPPVAVAPAPVVPPAAAPVAQPRAVEGVPPPAQVPLPLVVAPAKPAPSQPPPTMVVPSQAPVPVTVAPPAPVVIAKPAAPPPVAVVQPAPKPAPAPAPILPSPPAVVTKPAALPPQAAVAPRAVQPTPPPVPVVPAPPPRALFKSNLAMQLSALGVAAASGTASAVPQAFEVMQRARNRHESGAVSRITARFGRSDDALARVASVREDLLDRWHGLDKTIVDAGSRGDARASEEIASIDRQIAQQDSAIEQRVPGYKAYLNPETVALSSAQALLGSDEALLSYLVDENASYLVVVRRDRYAFVRLDIGQNELSSVVKRLREQLDYPSGDDAGRAVNRFYPVAQAQQLYRRLFAGAEPFLQGATHLMIVPDDALHGLPFAALVTEPFAGAIREPEEHAKVAWLGRRYALTMLPSEGVLRSLRGTARRAQATKAFVGFGDPLLGGEGRGVRSGTGSRAYSRDALANVNQIWSFAPLPETRYALYAMADILNAEPGDVHLQADASETSVKRLDLSDYRVIAFATYGFMADDFKGLAESALVFTPPQQGTELNDGLLTASEVAQLKLNADLVILTATSTAASDGTPDTEGVSGLARAFMYAGDRALLATHWTVPSDATLKLVTRALRERARGVGNAEALRRAMLPLMNGEDRLAFAHPSYWAPFMVIGEGNVQGTVSSAPVARDQTPAARSAETPASSPAQSGESGGGFGQLLQGIFGSGKK